MNRSRALCGIVIGQLLLAQIPLHSAEPERLTDTGRLKFTPVYCDQGRSLFFVELTDPTLYRLQRLDLATRTISPVNPAATTSEFEPSWAADYQCYAYLKTRGPLSIGITVCDNQGTMLGEIRPEPGFFGFRSPTMAPGKSQIAFSYGVGGTQQIFASRLNGDNRQPLTNSEGFNHWPAYSPDGRFITYGSSRDGNFEIYIMHNDGTDPRRLTDHPRQDIRPRFSPDGSQIAFTSHRDGNAEIYLMSADGTNLRRLTNHPERDDYADWHPDGQHLVTVSERKGRHEVYLWNIQEVEF
jgi:Tol biopolymer transport system component